MKNELDRRIPVKLAMHLAVCYGLAIASLVLHSPAHANSALLLDDTVTSITVSSQPNEPRTSRNSISGRIFIDNNVDGTNDATEHGFAELALVLYDIVNTTCNSTNTDSDGHYTFNNVPAGSYRIYEAANETVPTPQTCNPAQSQDPVGYVSTTDNVSTMLTIDKEDITEITGVDFGNVALPTFTSDNNGTIFPGNVKLYHHSFIAPSTGSVTFTRTVKDPNDWSSLLYHDLDCSGDLNGMEANALLTSPLSTNRGNNICLINNIFAPSVAKIGQQSIVSLTANFTYGTGSSHIAKQQLHNKDITTASHYAVTGSDTVEITKTIRNLTQDTSETQALPPANPGDTLEYRLTYHNTASSPAPLTQLKMNGAAIPAFALLDANHLLCENTPTTLTCTPNITSSDSDLIWKFTGKLNAGEQGSVTFRVTVE